MPVVSIFHPSKQQVISSKPLINILYQIQNDKYKDQVCKLRQYYDNHLDNLYQAQLGEIPRFTPSSNCRNFGSRIELISYSRVMCLSIQYLNTKDYDSIVTVLRTIPYVFSFFRNAQGTGLIILVQTDCMITHHKIAFRFIKKWFQDLLGVSRIEADGDHPKKLCRLSWDRELYLNLEAIPYPLQRWKAL